MPTEYDYNRECCDMDTMELKREIKGRIINEIKSIIPIGNYPYTENVISKKDIDDLIKNINLVIK